MLDGAEVAAATMCDITQCLTIPHRDLDRTDVSYQYRNKAEEQMQAAVEAARNEHLDPQGRVKSQHQTKVLEILYTILYTISIVYDAEYSSGQDKEGYPKYIITKTMTANIWARLRNRLASIDSSTSMIEVTSEYAAPRLIFSICR